MGEIHENATGRDSWPEMSLRAILQDADPSVRDAFMDAVARSSEGSRQRSARETPAVVVQLVVVRATTPVEA
jgi:hypothetical protein